MFGYEVDETLNMDTSVYYVDMESYEYIGKKAYPFITTGGVFSEDLIMKKKDGALIWCNLIGQAINPQNLEEGSIWSIHDISERKQMEDAVNKRIIALTQPLESGAISFYDLFNLDDVQRLQDQFAKATGVASIITDPDGTPLTAPSNFTRLCHDIIRKTEKGRANCYKSDAALGRYNPDSPNIQPCLSGGLFDAGAGITVGGQHIANWLIGQVRDETLSEEKMTAYANEIGAEEASFMDAFREVPSMSQKQFEQVAQALYTLASQLSNTAYQNVQQARFINERKQAEEELKNVSQRLQLATTSINMGVWDWNIRSNEMLWDDRMFELHGVTRESFQISFDAWTNLLHPGDKGTVIAECQAALNGEKKFDTFFRVCHPDGTVIFIRATGLVIWGTDGTAERMIGINVDITERKLAEIANTRFLLRQRAILDNLPMLAWLKDTEGRYEMINEPLAVACALSFEECIGKTDLDIWPHEMAKGYMADDREVCMSGQKKQVEELIYTSEGEKCWHITYKTPIFDEQGQIIGTAGIAQDITSIKEAEKERINLENQLNQSQKLESIGRLAGGVAHDFNNLLTPIIGYAELVKYKLPEDSPEARKLDNILQASDKARILTQQLLSFGRKQILDMTVVNLNEVISSFYEILRRTIRENIDIQLSLSNDGYGIRADRNQLLQIIMNLTINGQDSITDKGVITIGTAPVTLDDEYVKQDALVKAGRYLMLAVTDTGSGMDDETLSHVFEPFYTTKSRGEGTGLGLATVYGLVNQHGGYIRAFSELGQGTVFKLYFPIVDEKPTVAGEAASTHVTLNGTGYTIMLVEDNEMVRNMVYDLLTGHGFKVLVEENPKQALKISKGEQIDLLLTDVVMPDMNGPELHQRLLKTHPGLKVIYMSGYTDNVIVQHGVLEIGINFIQKPFAVNDLSNKIEAVLNAPNEQ